jgi:iron complex outermembrane recepter protein
MEMASDRAPIASGRFFAFVLSWVLFAPLAVHAQATYPFDLPSQPLAESLRAVGQQTSTNVMFEPRLVKGLAAPALRMQATTVEALRLLLAGTNLVVLQTAADTILIQRAAGGRKAEAIGRAASPASASAAGSGEPGVAAQDGDSSTSSSLVPAENRIELEEVLVTGSRIERAVTETPAPVVVFTRSEIERSGASTLQQLFNYLPQASMNNDASGSKIFGGATTIQLRGMPTGTTLVLINGRRTIVSGALFTANIFNMNSIPLSAVERVEVLTDSASAIYGADALAGVVNVILRKGISGSELSYRYGSAADGDTQSNRLSVTTGFDSEQFKVTAFLEGFTQTPLQGNELDRIANADYRRFGGPDRRSVFAAPGNVSAVPGTGNLPGLATTFAAIPAGQSGAALTPASFVATSGTQNLGPALGLGESDFVYDTERYSALVRADYEPARALRFFAEALVSDSTETTRLASLLSNVTVPATNAFNPFDANVRVNLLLPELPITRHFDWQYLRLLLGAGGSIGTWDWELGLLGTRDETTQRDANQVDFLPNGRLATALADPNPATAFNPFVGGAIPAAQVRGILRRDLLINLESQADQADLQFRGPLGALPAGPIEWAVGGEARKEVLQADSPSADLAPFDMDRNVRSGFLELSVPILGESLTVPLAQRVGLTAAVRYDRYSDFGSATSPQFGLTWTLVPQLTLRASRGEAFRPPSLRQLGAPLPLIFGVTDPRRGNEQYTTPGASGGNPDLDPEAGTSTNIGLVFTPFSDGRIVASVDAWRVELTERILRLTAATALANEALFPELVTRAAASAEDQAQGRPGRVVFLRSVFANFGRAELEGTDFRLTARNTLFGGELTNTLSATYVSRYDAAILPGQPLTRRVGGAVADGYAPRVKASWLGSWARAGWEISGGVRYIDSYQDYADPSGSRTVDSDTLFDMAVGYGWSQSAGAILGGAKLCVNLVNALDEEAPYSNDFTGYDSYQTDLLGRQVYVSLIKRFQ